MTKTYGSIAVLAHLILAAPAAASTVEDPDSPRFGEGLRVLGMRDQVEVVRIIEVASIDPEPLYLARTPDREAVFREGEDLCMAEGKLGHFVACNRDLKRAVDPGWTKPIRAEGITVWPTSAPPGRTRVPGSWGGGGGWNWGGGGGRPVVPVNPDVPVAPSPIPLPPAGWMLLAALLAAPLWKVAGRFGAWFTAERGAGPGKNGWV